MSNAEIWIQGGIAIGTIGSTIVALYFGIRGNRETRILVYEEKISFKNEALNFLLTILKESPPLNGLDSKLSPSTDMTFNDYINQFEKKLFLKSIFLSKFEYKRYKNFISLSREWSNSCVNAISTNDDSGLRKVFNKIEGMLLKGMKTCDDLTRNNALSILQTSKNKLFNDINHSE